MEIKVGYICDRQKCENCSNECKHTFDIKHAKNRAVIVDISSRYLVASVTQNEVIMFEKED